MKRFIATVAVVAALLGGCGDDGDDNTPTNTPTTEAPAGQGPRTGGSVTITIAPSTTK